MEVATAAVFLLVSSDMAGCSATHANWRVSTNRLQSELTLSMACVQKRRRMIFSQ